MASRPVSSQKDTSVISSNLERIPPHNKEAEGAVLGAILIDNKALDSVAMIITPDDFYTPAYRIIFRDPPPAISSPPSARGKTAFPSWLPLLQ